jgi:hypothetical protein
MKNSSIKNNAVQKIESEGMIDEADETMKEKIREYRDY